MNEAARRKFGAISTMYASHSTPGGDGTAGGGRAANCTSEKSAEAGSLQKKTCGKKVQEAELIGRNYKEQI